MINPIFIDVGVKLLSLAIDKIFHNEETYTAPKSGNTKRDNVYKDTLAFLKEHGEIVLDDIPGYIDDQVALLNKYDLTWEAGKAILKTIIKRIFAEEATDEDGAKKLSEVITYLLQRHAISADLISFIQEQVALLRKHKFLIKSK